MSNIRNEVIKRAGDALLERCPDIYGCDIDTAVEAVLMATVEAPADDTMRTYMTMVGWR